MEHLSLEIFDLATQDDPRPTTSKYAVLEDDQSITITDTSEVFASGDVWSYSFTLNVHANAHIFGTSGDLHGGRLHEQIDRRRARLWAEGLPMYLGYLKLGDEAEVDEEGNVDVAFESGQKTFEDMIEGAKANQVPLMSDVPIGVALWRKRWVSFSVNMKPSLVFEDGSTTIGGEYAQTSTGETAIGIESDGEDVSVQEYPAMVFPRGDFYSFSEHAAVHVDCLNTDYPYDDGHPYCNVALCYQRYGYDRKYENGEVKPDYSQEPEAERGYEYMPASRVNSAPNFYVIYWLRCLMKHLGIHVEENQMMDVEDLRRLFFVNTRCAYRKPDHVRSVDHEQEYNIYRFTEGRRLVPEKVMYIRNIYFQTGYEYLVNTKESGFVTTIRSIECNHPELIPTVKRMDVDIARILLWSDEEMERYEEENSLLHDAFATSDCFPDVDISEAISAIENGFGIRLLFSDSYQRVRIVLLRNVFRGQDIQDVACDVISDTKVENGIRGFRMTYGNSEDSHFYYKGFADMLPHMKTLWPDTSDKHDYSQWDLHADYADVIHKVSAFNKTCYVTPVNGNAYGVKVDKDAKRYEDLHPSLFEYAGFMDAEDGDCSGEEETIEEVSVGFTPAIMNDLNMEEERAGSPRQKFALFVDEQMRPRRPDLGDLTAPASYDDPDAYYDTGKLYEKYGSDGSDGNMTHDDGVVAPGEFHVMSDMYAVARNLKARLLSANGLDVTEWNVTFDIEGHVNEGYRLYLQDNFEPNDDGVPPVETHDWGLTLGIMRGSGSDATVSYEADPDDGEGNDTWELQAGSSVTAHPDTCDSYGSLWDYRDETKITVDTAPEALAALAELFPDSNAPFHKEGALGGYITGAGLPSVYDDDGREHFFLIATKYGSYNVDFGQDYIPSWLGKSVEEVMAMDAADKRIIVEADSSQERLSTLLELSRMAQFGGSKTITIDHGVDALYGRFSLKLRAEKPNPLYDPSGSDEDRRRRYLEIDSEDLRGRGLADQFYKEYSYWVRNARIARKTVRMELAQLLAIDKTKRVRVGDVMGFIRKMQYTVSNKTGLGEVTMEIMYI